MRVVRAAGQNVSPSDDGRLYDQIFTDGLFNEPAFTNLGSNNVQVGAIYGDLCGRDFTVEQMTLTVTLPEGEGETTGYIYVEIDTTSEDVISLNSALAPFTPTYEDINTNGAVAQMVLAEYTASAVAVTSVTPVYQKATAGSIEAGSVATVEKSQAVASHSSGDYILLDGKLYLVTASVAIGETFVVGTNIRAAVIGDTLSELKSGLTNLGTYLAGSGTYTTAEWAYGSTTVRLTVPTDGLYLCWMRFEFADASKRTIYKQFQMSAPGAGYWLVNNNLYYDSGNANSEATVRTISQPGLLKAGDTVRPYVHTGAAGVVFNVRVVLVRLN